jgi:phage host-nuclease inhibitor protein Gam
MAPTRRKAPRQPAPQTIDEATTAIAEYADIILGVEELRADADASIAAIQAERDRMIAPLEQRAKDLFLQLRAWWGVAAPSLTDGKRKSVELAGCVIGERTTPKSLKLPAKADESAALLVSAGLAQLCRHKMEVDKPAVLKVLTAEDELANLEKMATNDAARQLVAEVKAKIEKLRELGFKPVQKEEFFIDRAGDKPAAVEEVREAAE